MDKTIELGVIKGEQCNRDGCAGIIDEHEKEGSCSCHINPPCGYCTNDSAFCPVCDWQAGDDPVEKIDPEVEKRNQEYYKRESEKWTANRNLFWQVYPFTRKNSYKIVYNKLGDVTRKCYICVTNALK